MRIGLTGGIGCGKSTVGALLEKAGFRRLDSDVIVRQLLARDPAVIMATVGRFGEVMRLSDGGIDRAALARIVFASPEDLSWLEALLHPRVGHVWQSAVDETPEADWVVEIPLLFEKKLENHFDLTVCVTCSETEQFQRLARKQINEQQARARMERQMPLIDKVSKSDIVLLNNGSLSFLERQISLLVERLKTPA